MNGDFKGLLKAFSEIILLLKITIFPLRQKDPRIFIKVFIWLGQLSNFNIFIFICY